MTTPSERDGGQAYPPPYGSAPVYSEPEHRSGYGDAPRDEPTTEHPTYDGYGGSPYDTPPTAPQPAHEAYSAGDGAGDTTVLAPPAPARRRRPLRGPVALLLACLLSGGVGGAVATAIDDDPAPAASSVPTAIIRGTSTPANSTPGTAQSAAAIISPSVVTIAVTGQQTVTGSFGQRGTQSVSDTGSGIVFNAERGYIVTNNHVVAAAVDGGTVSVTFSDGSTVPATIVGTDPSSDLAVIKVDKAGLTAAAFADSDKLAVGQAVIAVGAPLGLSNTVTEGIVSTLNRPVRTGEAGATEQSVIDAVQTDAAINPGNSGGALVDLAGQVVGVNSAIATTGDSSSGQQSGNIGVGFAIPSNDVAEVAQELIANGRATHPQIGISVGDAPSAADGTPGRGAVVQSVTAGGPAATAGLQADDIITKVDDRAVTDADSLIVAVRSHDPGDRVTVTYLRGGATQTTQATLVEAPQQD